MIKGWIIIYCKSYLLYNSFFTTPLVNPLPYHNKNSFTATNKVINEVMFLGRKGNNCR